MTYSRDGQTGFSGGGIWKIPPPSLENFPKYPPPLELAREDPPPKRILAENGGFYRKFGHFVRHFR